MKRPILIIVALLFSLGAVTVVAAQGATSQANQRGYSPEAVSAIGEPTMIEIYCLQTKWKSGEFFAMIDAAQEHLPSALEEVSDLGVEISGPDLEQMESTAQGHLDRLCQAESLAAAEKALADFKAYAESARKEFTNLKSELETKLSAKEKELRSQIQDAVEPAIKAEIKRVEESLKNKAEAEAKKAKSQIESELANKTFSSIAEAEAYVRQRMPSLEASVRSTMATLSSAQKDRLRSFAQQKVQELAPPFKEKFEAVGQTLNQLEGQIRSGVQSRLSQYQTYRDQALAKRKTAVMKAVDAKLAEAKAALEANSDLFDRLREQEPDTPTVEELLAEMRADRDALEKEISEALADGDETAFASALSDFRSKWEGYREETEQAFKDPTRVCGQVQAQFKAARPGIKDQIKRIDDLMASCQGQDNEMCQKTAELSGRLTEASERLQDILDEMDRIEGMCATAISTGELDEDLLDALDDLKKEGEKVKTLGQALEADKKTADQWAQLQASQICQENLARMEASRAEMDRLYQGWRTKLAECQAGADDAICDLFDQLESQISSIESKAKELEQDSDDFREACRSIGPNTTAEEIWEIFNSYRELFSDVDRRIREIKYEVADLTDVSRVCQAGRPLVEAASRDFHQAVEKMQAARKGLSEVKTSCAQDSSQSFCQAYQTAASDADQVVADLKKFDDLFWQFDGICRGDSAGADRIKLINLIDSLDKAAQSGRQAAVQAQKDLRAVSEQYNKQ